MAFRDGPIGGFRIPLSWTATAATGAALLVALAVLVVGHRQAFAPGAYAGSRGQFDELLEPVAGVLAAPVRWAGEGADYVRGYVAAASENRRLKQQVSELQRWKDAAIALKSVNDRYEALLKLRTEPPIPSVAARVTLDARGPFSNARLADAGAERGVKVGDPVISEHGAVGRVVGTTKGASRILLLTDVESRTPVVVDRTGARGILVGDGGSYPRIDYVRGQDPIRSGDVLLTSGDGGGYPRGLPVGVASTDLRGAWRAKLYSDRAPIDYVRILSYEDFSASVDPKTLNGDGAMPALTAEEQKALQAPPPPAPKPPAANPASGDIQVAPAPHSPAAAPAAPKSVQPALAKPAVGRPAPTAAIPHSLLPPVHKPRAAPPAPPARKSPTKAGAKPKPKPSATVKAPAAKPTALKGPAAKPKPKAPPRPPVRPAASPLADMEGLH